MAAVTRYGPGQEPPHRRTSPGDFILTHRRAFPSAMIVAGQRLRFLGERRAYAHWSHAALIVGACGELVEALGAGVVGTHLERYRDVEYHLVHVHASDADRGQVVRYAEIMRARHERYDWAEIISLGLALLTGNRLTLTNDNHAICSGLVATALERTGEVFVKNAGAMLPADLAVHYDVRP